MKRVLWENHHRSYPSCSAHQGCLFSLRSSLCWPRTELSHRPEPPSCQVCRWPAPVGARGENSWRRGPEIERTVPTPSGPPTPTITKEQVHFWTRLGGWGTALISYGGTQARSGDLHHPPESQVWKHQNDLSPLYSRAVNPTPPPIQKKSVHDCHLAQEQFIVKYNNLQYADLQLTRHHQTFA